MRSGISFTLRMQTDNRKDAVASVDLVLISGLDILVPSTSPKPF